MEFISKKLRSTLSIFSNKQFVKLWGNQILLQTAFNMANFTCLLLIDNFSSSRFALAQFYAAMTLPAFIVGFFAGSIVDTYNRKKLIVLTNISLAILFLSYALFSDYHWAILLIAFLASSITQFFSPAEAASIPLLVKKVDLEKANSLFLFTGLGSVMLGYALAGPLIQLFGGLPDGARASFVVASLITVVGFFLTSTLRNIGDGNEKLSNQIFKQTIKLTKELIVVTRKNYKITIPIGLLTLIEFNVGLLAILFIDYVKKYLNLPTTSTSYFLVAPLITGIVLGIKILNLTKIKWGRMTTIYIGTLTFGFIILLLGIIGILASGNLLNILTLRIITILCALTSGIAVVFIAVNARTILQENTPPKMLGRVFSLVTVSASAITPIPVLLVGLITEKVDVSTVFSVFGTVVVLSAVILKPILKRKILKSNLNSK